MPRFTFADYEAAQERKANKAEGSTQKARVSYFSLKNDGDSAIVRFPYASTEEFELAAVHSVQVGERTKKVNCLRKYSDPLDKCPLCACEDEKMKKVQTRFFCRVVEYVDDGQGNVVPTAKIWEKPMAFAKELASKMKEYGPVNEYCCKIVRHGKAGDRETTYDVIPLVSPSQMRLYSDEVYSPVCDGFDEFSLSPFFVMDKTADDMKVYLETGDFPSFGVNAAQTNSIPVAPKAAPVSGGECLEDVEPVKPVASGNGPRRYTF